VADHGRDGLWPSRNISVAIRISAQRATSVRIALKYAPKSIHLRAADFALECKLTGKQVPDRLVKFIGYDNGALLRRICPEPFQRSTSVPSGEVLVCCGHWVPTSIGNLMTDGVDQISIRKWR